MVSAVTRSPLPAEPQTASREHFQGLQGLFGRQFEALLRPEAAETPCQTDGGGRQELGAAAPDPLEVLRNALGMAGIDPEPLGLRIEETTCYYPGASWVNRSVLARIGGREQAFDVSLMLRNPSVTVIEIRSLLHSAPAS